MNRKRFALISISAAAVTAAAAVGCSSRYGSGGGSNGLPDILSVFEGRSKASFTLTCEYATNVIGGKTFHTRTYDGKTHGPMLTVRPGQMLDVTIVNKFPKNPHAKVPRGPVRVPLVSDEMEAMNNRPRRFRLSSVQIDPMNNPHDFNTTNLHVHGIQTIPHIFSPIGTSDPKSMMIAIEPGESFTYHLPVPDDHPSGLHWYHPHHHGATDVQVSSGMAGLIVVRGPIDDVPEIAAAKEIFMVFQALGGNKGKHDPSVYELEYEAYKAPQEGGYQLEPDFSMLTVNGQGVAWDERDGETERYTPLEPFQVTMQPGEVRRLRMLNGFNHDPIPLVLEGFEVWQIGFDGVNLTAPNPKNMSGIDDQGNIVEQLTAKNFITAPVRMSMPGNRIELLIKAPKKPGTYALKSLGSDGLNGGKLPTYTLAQFTVAGNELDMKIPRTLPKPTREYPIIGEVPESRKKTFTYSVAGLDTPPAVLTGLAFYVNGELYDEMGIPTTVELGSEWEWRIENKSLGLHPFHIHVNSFQLTEINDQAAGASPEIWDTFYVPPRSSRTDGKPGSITLRIRFVQFKGKSLHHCHILPHEDTGMMQNFLIE